MARSSPRPCPECGEVVRAEPMNRRGFLRAAGAGAAALAMSRFAGAREDRTAEDLIRELYTGLTEDQKLAVVLKMDSPDRARFHNKALGKKIGEVYTKA